MVANTPASRKAKGRAFQQELRDSITENFDVSPIDVQSTAMGQAGADIYLSKKAREKFPYAVEAKRSEAIQIWKALEQCEANARKLGLKPLLAFRRNRGETYAVLRWSDFIELAKRSGEDG